MKTLRARVIWVVTYEGVPIVETNCDTRVGSMNAYLRECGKGMRWRDLSSNYKIEKFKSCRK